jgi:PAS domain S-box-containing protein
LHTFEGPRQDLRHAFEQAGGGMAVVDPTGRLVEVNPALCRLTGRQRGALAGTTLPALHHPGDPDALQGVDSQKTMLQADRTLLDASGGAVPVLLTLLALDEPAGEQRTLAHAQPRAAAGGRAVAAREAAAAAVALRVLGGQALGGVLGATVRDITTTLGVERAAVVELVERPPGQRTLRLRAALGWDETLAAATMRTAGAGGEMLADERPLPLSDPELTGAVVRIGPPEAPVGLLAAASRRPHHPGPTGLFPADLEFLQVVADLLAAAGWQAHAQPRPRRDPQPA